MCRLSVCFVSAHAVLLTCSRCCQSTSNLKREKEPRPLPLAGLPQWQHSWWSDAEMKTVLKLFLHHQNLQICWKLQDLRKKKKQLQLNDVLSRQTKMPLLVGGEYFAVCAGLTLFVFNSSPSGSWRATTFHGLPSCTGNCRIILVLDSL